METKRGCFLGWGACFGAVKVAVLPYKRWAFAVFAVAEPLAGCSDLVDPWHVASGVKSFFGGFTFADLFKESFHGCCQN